MDARTRLVEQSCGLSERRRVHFERERELRREITEVYERGVHVPERQLCELASLEEERPEI